MHRAPASIRAVIEPSSVADVPVDFWSGDQDLDLSSYSEAARGGGAPLLQALSWLPVY